jgi:hypothetical protein
MVFETDPHRRSG